MGILDVFRRKTTKENNALFGQTALGNQILWAKSGIEGDVPNA